MSRSRKQSLNVADEEVDELVIVTKTARRSIDLEPDSFNIDIETDFSDTESIAEENNQKFPKTLEKPMKHYRVIMLYQEANFWRRGIEDLPRRWKAVVDNNGNYVDYK
ncbi:hypothetical protein DdX_19725 [Ditylenchus destructor]|uniref:Uncharacterized protein n=1 Tax=Ditylenchus destructor TaxID=166010 RepID=A0AAD4MJ11_9BILA|nr:hypothetical protein DdX_19725 [Ditylenchus destructor]